MTVKELIEGLQKMPGDAKVKIKHLTIVGVSCAVLTPTLKREYNDAIDDVEEIVYI